MSELPFKPAEYFHPGELIRDELEARGWGNEEFAKKVGLSVEDALDLLHGRRNISRALAKRLALVFEQTTMFFMNIQATYDKGMLLP